VKEKVFVTTKVPKDALIKLNEGVLAGDPVAIYIWKKCVMDVFELVKAAGCVNSGEECRITFIASDQVTLEDKERKINVSIPVFGPDGEQITSRPFDVFPEPKTDRNN